MKEKKFTSACGVFKLRKLASGEKRWKVSFFNKVTNSIIHSHFEDFKESLDWIESMRYDYSNDLMQILQDEIETGFICTESESDFV